MTEVPAATVPALLRLGALPQRSWDDALEEVLQIDAGLLHVDRVSYWSFQREPPAIVCELGYVRSKRLLERGATLLERDCAEYVAEARRVQVIAVEDAQTDPRLASLREYLESHGIGALLDVPVFARGALVGVLCHEHVGGSRAWTVRESELALAMSQTVAALLEARARSDAEDAERRAAFLARTSSMLASALDVNAAQRMAVELAIPMLGDLATLIGYDGERAYRITHAHATPEGRAVLDELASRFGRDIDGPGIGMQALRERQSLLLPVSEPAALRAYGLEPGHIELLERLRIRSVMAVLIHARGEITGVLSFGATARTYGRDDLRFAEAYASQVGLLLSNVELYRRANDAVRARDEFISLAAHELRTPIASLTFSADLLARQTPSDAPRTVRRAVMIMRRQTRRLARLSDLLIVASQPEESAVPMTLETIDVSALVREVVADFEDGVGRAGCALRLTAEKPVLIRGDRAELKVVVSNLLDNAMKFGAGRPIDVAVEEVDGRAKLAVRDQGIGIPDEQHARLFRRFERGVSSRHFGGLGLGLHIASRIVAAHGGSIRAESGDGQGAALIVELPREAKDGAPTEPDKPES